MESSAKRLKKKKWGIGMAVEKNQKWRLIIIELVAISCKATVVC